MCDPMVFAIPARCWICSCTGEVRSQRKQWSALALSALGPYRKELKPDKQAEYVARTKAYIGRFFLRYSDRFSQANLKIDSCAGDLVKTTAGSNNLVWKISGGKIRDVQISGIWLANQMRSKFVSEIRRGGHEKIDALFKFLGKG
jgi:ABC-type transporter MlaC component